MKISSNSVLHFSLFKCLLILCLAMSTFAGCDNSDGSSTSTWYLDADGDGYGNPNEYVKAESQTQGYVADNTDCNDSDSKSNPVATELCGDNTDNDCDGTEDEDCFNMWFFDEDGDGYGDPDDSIKAESQPNGYVNNNLDCDDTDANINPGATEIPVDGIDQDCNGSDAKTDPKDVDNDGDGQTENQGDCNDNDSTIYSGADEICDDDIDQDCDGSDLACAPDPEDVDDDMEFPSQGLVKSSSPYDEAPAYSASDLTAMIAGFFEFTIDFYHALANDPEKEGENLFFSTYSIENALAMTWAGAQNHTAVQMADTLHLYLPQNSFHPTLNALNIDINSRDDQPPPSGDAFALNLVNAIWSRIGYPFLTDYLDVIAKDYDAGIHTLDFMGNPEHSRQIINQWVEDQTNEKIKDLLPPDSISPSTAVVLTNTIYFKGSWYEKFDVERTVPGAFTLLNGITATTELMHRGKDTRYFKGDGFDAVELPYASPNFPDYAYPQELAMLVIIPNAGEFESVENSLNKARLDAIVDSLSMGTVDFTFPKFEFECETKCKDILKGLGMRDAFDSSLADFSGMVSPVHSKPWIDEVYHKAFVAVDETGTEAAAATAVVMTDTAMPEIVKISADKPFVFIIYDHFTQTILFMGRVVDPTA